MPHKVWLDREETLELPGMIDRMFADADRKRLADLALKD